MGKDHNNYNTIFISVIMCFIFTNVYTQVPNAINFQAIARDNYENIMSETTIMIQLRIIDGDSTGAPVYREIRSLTTNSYGSFSFQIGRDPFMSEGDFADIDWAGGAKFLEIDYDPTATLNFDLTLGIIELVSVPYAFAVSDVLCIDANEAIHGSIFVFNENTSKFEPNLVSFENVTWNNIQNKPSFSTVSTNGDYNALTDVPQNISYFNNDSGYLTESPYFQVSTYGDTLFLSNGSWVIISGISNANPPSSYFGEPCINMPICIDERDGNVYPTVQIGNQCWMGKNLAYLPSVAAPSQLSQTEPLFYVYSYAGTSVIEAKSEENYLRYGVLYNWSSAMNGFLSSSSNPSGVQGICPSGWHLPSDAEWTELINFIGGEGVAGGKMKEVGLDHWLAPNEGATNDFGFSALPGGRYDFSIPRCASQCSNGYWWSSTRWMDFNKAWYYRLEWDTDDIDTGTGTTSYGFSVRCVLD